jgi:hypothetical protein
MSWLYSPLLPGAGQQQSGGAPPATTILPQIMQHSYGDEYVRQIRAGTTDVSVVIRIIDSADGTPETAVAFDTGGIDLWYRREGAASTDITEATLSALTDAHSDGGFLHINDGWYRLDLPDAACGANATGVQIGGTVTGMVVLAPYIELVAYNPYDTVRLGLTALPNAAAEAAGGIYTRGSGAGQINQTNNGRVDTDVAAIAANAITATAIAANAIDADALAADAVTEIQSGLATAAALDTVDNLLDTEIAAIITAVDALPTNAELATALGTADDAVLAAIAGLNDLSVADILTAALADAYAANGVAPTLQQAIMGVHQYLMEKDISGTDYTVKKLDGNDAFVVTLNDATTPTASSRD